MQNTLAHENGLKKEMELLATWIEAKRVQLDKMPSISLDINQLKEQVNQFREPYAEILAKEGSFVNIR